MLSPGLPVISYFLGPYKIFKMKTLITTLCVLVTLFAGAQINETFTNGIPADWETATEIDNWGFHVQSKEGNAEWRSIRFIVSKASDGISNSILNYSYTDVNISEATIQYRLEQTDRDGKKAYSEIRFVKAEKLSIPILLYPNPAKGGKFYIITENANAGHEVKVNDAAGNLVKSYSNIRSTSLLVEG
jgi:hypothetical protein